MNSTTVDLADRWPGLPAVQIVPLNRLEADQVVLIRDGVAVISDRRVLDHLFPTTPTRKPLKPELQPAVGRAAPSGSPAVAAPVTDYQLKPAKAHSRKGSDKSPTGVPWVEIQQLWNGGQGLSVQELAIRAGCTDAAIYYHMKKEHWRSDVPRPVAATPAPVTETSSATSIAIAEEETEETAPAEKAPAYSGPLRRRCHSCSRTTTTDPCQFCFEKALKK